MATNSKQVVSFMLAFLFTQLMHPHRCMGDDSTNVGRCRETEREALLQFKGGLHDPADRLSSWAGEDCCGWHGVSCHNRTGSVLRLDLRNPQPYLDLRNTRPYVHYFLQHDFTWCFSGEINPSLLRLTHLKYLDLSANCFNSTRIPKFIGSFKELRYLNLSVAGFDGVVPHELGNLSSLRHLDLSILRHLVLTMVRDDDFIIFSPEYPGLYVDNLRWLFRLDSLQYLDMSGVDLNKASSRWVQQLNSLPSLRVIHLEECSLGEKIPLSLPHNNLTSLSVLDLSHNFINSTIPNWLFNMSGLQQLNLRENRFSGIIPVAMGKAFPFLEVLDLSYNDLRFGKISETLGNLCKLQKLSLTGVYINQELTEFEQMFSGCMTRSLESLDMIDNGLTGIIPESLGDLSKIKYLDLSENKISGPLPVSLGRLSSLQELDFSYNDLNGTVPESLGQLLRLVQLNLCSNFLNGVLSEVHFSGLNKLEYLFLDSNPLVLKVSPDWVPPFQLNYIDMGSCTVGPKFPAWLKSQVNLSYIYLSNTGISDTIPSWFWNLTLKIISLDLSFNQICGKLPQSLIFATVTQEEGTRASVDLSSNLFDGPVPQILSSVIALDLRNNSLSGSLPPNIENSWPQLTEISLSMNNINGSIPSSFCKMRDLYYLDLSSNQLSGKVPNCWSKFSYLGAVNLANNNLSGGISKTLCSIPDLNILYFQNNCLTGELPMSLKKCVNLQALDLGQNKFMGNIPWWIGESLLNLIFLRLNSNMFDGRIPPQLSHLTQLQILDLSANNLWGTIPTIFANFSAMKNSILSELPRWYIDENSVTIIMKRRKLEYKDWVLSTFGLIMIDLSSNRLSGNIPEEVANLSRLQSLNLSRNLLTGQITERIGNLRQLESLDLSSNMLSGSIPQSLSSLTFLEALNLSYNNLSGRIPQGNQLQTFINPSIYAGNINLCGFPLTKKCQDDVSQATPSIMPSDSVEVEEDDETWFYAGMGLGFAASFSIVWWLLLVKEALRHAYFRFIDDIYDRLYVVVVVNIARLKYKLQARRQGHTPSL